MECILFQCCRCVCRDFGVRHTWIVCLTVAHVGHWPGQHEAPEAGVNVERQSPALGQLGHPLDVVHNPVWELRSRGCQQDGVGVYELVMAGSTRWPIHRGDHWGKVGLRVSYHNTSSVQHIVLTYLANSNLYRTLQVWKSVNSPCLIQARM